MIWFFGTLLVLGLAVLLEAGPERAVRVPWLNIVLPETCATRRHFGFDCPGCGLTRSFIHIADGDLAAAWRLNWTSVLIFAYAVVQLPLALAYWAQVEERWFGTLVWINERFVIVLALILAFRWVWLGFSGGIF